MVKRCWNGMSKIPLSIVANAWRWIASFVSSSNITVRRDLIAYVDYFAWGETSTKASYTWDTYRWGTQNNLTKYNSTDGKITLDTEDDAATANMGTDWKTPTITQWKELIENCTWTWETINGIKGQIVKSKTNNNSIFLPAQGFYLNSQNVVTGGNGYWSIDLSEEFMESYAIGFAQNGTYNESKFPQSRSLGMPIRAVKKQ